MDNINWKEKFMDAACMLRERQFDGEETATGHYKIYCRTCGSVEHPDGYLAHQQDCELQNILNILEDEEDIQDPFVKEMETVINNFLDNATDEEFFEVLEDAAPKLVPKSNVLPFRTKK